MHCPPGYYRKTANLRVRPVHEMELCLVFTPDNPSLYSLNPTAWLIFELCDGGRLEDLERAYYDVVEPHLSRDEAREELQRGIADLERKGIVEHVAEITLDQTINPTSEGRT